MNKTLVERSLVVLVALALRTLLPPITALESQTPESQQRSGQSPPQAEPQQAETPEWRKEWISYNIESNSGLAAGCRAFDAKQFLEGARELKALEPIPLPDKRSPAFLRRLKQAQDKYDTGLKVLEIDAERGFRQAADIARVGFQDAQFSWGIGAPGFKLTFTDGRPSGVATPIGHIAYTPATDAIESNKKRLVALVNRKNDLDGFTPEQGVECYVALAAALRLSDNEFNRNRINGILSLFGGGPDVTESTAMADASFKWARKWKALDIESKLSIAEQVRGQLETLRAQLKSESGNSTALKSQIAEAETQLATLSDSITATVLGAANTDRTDNDAKQRIIDAQAFGRSISGIFSRVNPKVGEAIEILSDVFFSVKLVRSFSKDLNSWTSLAGAASNILGALLHRPDVDAIRHAEVMDGLRRVHADLVAGLRSLDEQCNNIQSLLQAIDQHLFDLDVRISKLSDTIERFGARAEFLHMDTKHSLDEIRASIIEVLSYVKGTSQAVLKTTRNQVLAPLLASHMNAHDFWDSTCPPNKEGSEFLTAFVGAAYNSSADANVLGEAQILQLKDIERDSIEFYLPQLRHFAQNSLDIPQELRAQLLTLRLRDAHVWALGSLDAFEFGFKWSRCGLSLSAYQRAQLHKAATDIATQWRVLSTADIPKAAFAEYRAAMLAYEAYLHDHSGPTVRDHGAMITNPLIAAIGLPSNYGIYPGRGLDQFGAIDLRDRSVRVDGPQQDASLQFPLVNLWLGPRPWTSVVMDRFISDLPAGIGSHDNEGYVLPGLNYRWELIENSLQPVTSLTRNTPITRALGKLAIGGRARSVIEAVNRTTDKELDLGSRPAYLRLDEYCAPTVLISVAYKQLAPHDLCQLTIRFRDAGIMVRSREVVDEEYVVNSIHPLLDAAFAKCFDDASKGHGVPSSQIGKRPSASEIADFVAKLHEELVLLKRDLLTRLKGQCQPTVERSPGDIIRAVALQATRKLQPDDDIGQALAAMRGYVPSLGFNVPEWGCVVLHGKAEAADPMGTAVGYYAGSEPQGSVLGFLLRKDVPWLSGIPYHITMKWFHKDADQIEHAAKYWERASARFSSQLKSYMEGEPEAQALANRVDNARAFLRLYYREVLGAQLAENPVARLQLIGNMGLYSAAECLGVLAPRESPPPPLYQTLPYDHPIGSPFRTRWEVRTENVEQVAQDVSEGMRLKSTIPIGTANEARYVQHVAGLPSSGK